MEWYALYTKPRWEKKVAKALEKIGIIVYCPMITEVRQWSDRKKKVTLPLFKSYVFIRIPKKKGSQILEVPGVVQFVYWLGNPAIIKDSEIKIIKKWLEGADVESIEISELNAGDRLTIANGSFKGKEATISEIGKKRVRLILKNLGIVLNVRLSEAVY